MRPQRRITDPKSIDRLLIDTELKNGMAVIIQFSDKFYDDKTLNDLNELCSIYDWNFSIRFFRHPSIIFDCNTILKIPNVKSLYIDCLNNVINLEALTRVKNLQRLSVGIYELKETEILQSENLRNLIDLMIIDNKAKSINLEYLKDYKSLTSLIICGHIKNINAVGELTDLEYLGLNSISKVPLHFINRLKKLKTLNFVLGARNNLDELEENEIENLEIIRVRGFNSFKNISNFKALKNLQIEDQIQLVELNFDKPLPNLETIKILNCKKFSDLLGLENLTSLNHLRIFKTDIDFDKLVQQKFPDSLDIFAFYTWKSKIDKKIEEKLKSMGYRDGL